MDEWAVFLKARLDEEEAAAKAAASVGRLRWAALGGMVVDADDHDWAVTTDTLGEIAAHIALHDPDRALRKVATARKALAEYQDSAEGSIVRDALGFAVFTFAAAWDDHPDYPGAKKSGHSS